MSIRHFRYLCGLTVLITHILAVAMIGSANRFTDIQDQIGSILIVVPITLVYASAFVRFVAANAAPAPPGADERFDPMAAGVMYFVVAVFCASLLYVTIKFTYLSSYQVSEFKMWLGACETAFGALIGIVFEKLFGAQFAEAKAAIPKPAEQ
jgi:hypothetical protein